jgi:hypothetical protein
MRMKLTTLHHIPSDRRSRFRTGTTLLCATAAALWLVACAAPPPPPPVYASEPAPGSDSLIVPVVSLTRALPDSAGRWVVLAPTEGKVLVADFSTGRAVPFPGITKADVPEASTLFRAGDTVFVGDWGLRRVTAWTPDGKRVAAWPMPDVLRGAVPRARDAAGQWYFQIDPDPKDDGSGLLDSAAVVRSDPQLTHFDTLARLAPPVVTLTQGLNGNRYQRRALAGSDQWGVEPDGTFWIARTYQNVVEWHGRSGQVIRKTRPLPDRVLPVTQLDRQVFLQKYPEDQRPIAARLPFAAVKPPFEAAFPGAGDRMWLFKSDTALAPVRQFQVVDTSGVLFYVTVPSRGTPIGMESERVVMAEQFPGGVRLLRYVLPVEARR